MQHEGLCKIVTLAFVNTSAGEQNSTGRLLHRDFLDDS